MVGSVGNFHAPFVVLPRSDGDSGIRFNPYFDPNFGGDGDVELIFQQGGGVGLEARVWTTEVGLDRVIESLVTFRMEIARRRAESAARDAESVEGGTAA